MCSEEPQTEWRAVVGVGKEVCGNCDATLYGHVGDACPDCGHYRCPYLDSSRGDPCGATYETQKGMRLHHSLTHDFSYRDYADCNHCGDQFIKRENDQQFCSVDCSTARHEFRITKECPFCRDDFETRPCDNRTYCSTECFNESRIDREVRICPHCADDFETYPCREREFCSRKCFNKHGATGPTEYTCAFCADDFEDYNDRTYCSPLCAREDRKDRPEDIIERLHELFIEERHSVVGVSRRVPEMGTETIRSRLIEEGWYRKQQSLADQLRDEDVTSVDDIDFEAAKPGGAITQEQ